MMAVFEEFLLLIILPLFVILVPKAMFAYTLAKEIAGGKIDNRDRIISFIPVYNTLFIAEKYGAYIKVAKASVVALCTAVVAVMVSWFTPLFQNLATEIVVQLGLTFLLVLSLVIIYVVELLFVVLFCKDFDKKGLYFTAVIPPLGFFLLQKAVKPFFTKYREEIFNTFADN
jgi:hypothetical protein